MHQDTMMRRLSIRLRRPPAQHTVAGSLPVLFFGNLFTATIATIGINPSNREYVDKSGRELDGTLKRFETLSSLGATSREALTDEQCDRAIDTMSHCFGPRRPVYEWFRSMEDLLNGMGYSYKSSLIAHLDLVHEATKPTWSGLQQIAPQEAQELLRADVPFLRDEIAAFPLRVVLCNGRTPFDTVRQMLGGEEVASGTLQRITWRVAAGTIAGRRIGIAGWNIPLARSTGLTNSGPRSKGAVGGLLREELSQNDLL